MTRSWIFHLALIMMIVGAVGHILTPRGGAATRVFDDLLAPGSAIVLCTLAIELSRPRRRPTMRDDVLVRELARRAEGESV